MSNPNETPKPQSPPPASPETPEFAYRADHGGHVPSDTKTATPVDWIGLSQELHAILARQFNHPDAEDALQDALLRALEEVRDGRAPAIRNPAAWLRVVARRAAAANNRRRRHRTLRDDLERTVWPLEVRAAEEERAKQREAVVRAVGGLPDSLRAVFVLCVMEGMTYRETARHLAIPAGTVSGRLARAKRQVRAALLRDGLTP